MELRTVTSEPIGLMLSGGLDSAVLLSFLLNRGHRVQPFYVNTGCRWESVELSAADRLICALDTNQIDPLVTLDMPADDLYGEHWSTTGDCVPGADSCDSAVQLPARNPLLLLKPLIWCGQHGVAKLAIATLFDNPFDDATPEFFHLFQASIAVGTGAAVEILRPFENLTKAEVLEHETELPLHLTFSCLAPQNGMHCGDCNKCAERARSLQSLPFGDPTAYARGVATT